MKPSPKDFHHFIAECDVPSSSCEIYLKVSFLSFSLCFSEKKKSIKTKIKSS